MHRSSGMLIRATGPNHVVHMDLVVISGKAVEGITNPTYTQVFTMVDAFSNFIVTVPLGPKVTAADIFTLFLQHWIAIFGAPKEGILTDNATVFQSELTRMCCHILGLKHLEISPYKSSGNLSERMQRAILSMISTTKATLQLHPVNWNFLLHFMTLAHNSQPHETTGVAPMMAFLGRNNTLGLKNFINLEFVETCDDYVQNMVRAQEIISRALDKKRIQKENIEKQNMTLKQRREYLNSFPERTLVYVQRRNLPTDPMHKLRVRYEGPFIVTKEFKTKVLVIPYKREDLVADKPKLHIKGHGRPIPTFKRRVVDKSRLKRVNSLQLFSTGLARDVKHAFLGGIDLSNLEYKSIPLPRPTVRGEKGSESSESDEETVISSDISLNSRKEGSILQPPEQEEISSEIDKNTQVEKIINTEENVEGRVRKLPPRQARPRF